MQRYNGPGALAGAAEVRDRVCAEERRPDTTPYELRLAAIRRLRRQRLVECIHALGPRVLLELINEIGRHYGLGADLDHRLERYASLDPLILAAIGGDRMPAPAIHPLPS